MILPSPAFPVQAQGWMRLVRPSSNLTSSAPSHRWHYRFSALQNYDLWETAILPLASFGKSELEVLVTYFFAILAEWLNKTYNQHDTMTLSLMAMVETMLQTRGATIAPL